MKNERVELPDFCGRKGKQTGYVKIRFNDEGLSEIIEGPFFFGQPLLDSEGNDGEFIEMVVMYIPKHSTAWEWDVKRQSWVLCE
jgi:hypothetical protein